MKIKSLALSVLILAGCAKDTLIEQQNTEVISFSPYVGKSPLGTRAVEMNAALLRSSGFQVYGFKNNGTANTAITEGFDGSYFSSAGAASPLSLTWDATNAAWTTSAEAFWPRDNATLDFIAIPNYSPQPSLSLSSGAVLSFNQDGMGSTSDVTQMKDLLAAVNHGIYSPAAPVNLAFRHLLSKITFNAILNDTDPNMYVVISRVQLNQLRPSGSYTFTGSNASGTFGTWVASGTPSDVLAGLVTFNDETVNGGETSQNITNLTTGAIMIVPQTLSTLTIDYEIREIGATQPIETESLTLNLDSPTLLPGRQYIFDLRIAPKVPITFTTSIVDWEQNPSNPLPVHIDE